MALFEAVPSRRDLSGQLIWFSAWAVITVIGLALTPNASGHGTHQSLGLPPCPSVMLFDRPCPGCGLTTSWTALLHGNLGLAFAAHPMGPLMYLLYTISAMLSLVALVRVQRFDADAKWVNLSVKAFAVLFIGFGIARFAFTPHFASEQERIITRFVTGTR